MGTMKIKTRIAIVITLIFLIMIAVSHTVQASWVQSMILNMPMKSAAVL